MEEEIKPQADNLFSKVISGMKTVFDNVSLLSSDRKHKPYKRPRPRYYFAAMSSVSATTSEGAAEIPTTVPVGNTTNTNDDKMPEEIVQENVGTPQREEIQVKSDEVFAAEVAPKLDKTMKSPKKKKEKKAKNKDRSGAVKVKVADNSDMEQSSQPMKNKQNEESKDEPSSKPRIVLKIRSEKLGPKDTDVKLVCESDKPKPKSFKRQKTKFVTHRFASRNGEKKSEETFGSSMKRSTRRLSKEYSENILANAIARKQKSFNEIAPTKRRIKPTAKILANAEMRLGLESQNIARLQSAPVRTRRSLRALTTETLEKDTVEKKSMNTRKKLGKVAKDNASSDGIKDDIKENKAELSKIESSSEEMEAQRLNRLKRKHLSTLGLRAVVRATQNGQCISDDLIDDSTMDSTELEALTEHLNLHPAFDQEKQVPQKPIVNFDESVIVTEKATTTLPKRPSSEVAPEETTALRKLRSSGRRKQSLIDSVNTINRSSQISPIIVETIDDRDPESIEIVQNIVGCLCNEPTDLYIAPKMLEDPVYCKAVDHIDKLQVGCCHLASKEDDTPDSEYSPLVRASVRSPFILACHMHRARMAMHHCCPGCGLFCTQGTFYQCSRGHFFHPDCVLPHPIALQSELRYTGDCELPLGCPHCGVDRVIMQNVNSEIWIVTIEMDCSSRSIIIPYQRMDLCPTYLSFRPPKNDSKHTAKAHVPVPRRSIKRDVHPIVPPSMLPTVPIDLEALRVGKMRMIDYDDVLIGAANVESPQEDLYSAILNKDNYANVADRILAALAVHANPHKRLLAVENGTYLHLAAKEFNLAAVHILCCMNCSLDALDNQARTPLMVAILNFDGDLCMGTDQTKTGDTANEILYAMKMSVIRYFIKGGSNIMQKGPDGLTCLHLAAKCGNVTACEILLDSLPYLKVPAYMNLQDEGGWTALVWAAENKHTEVVKFLLSRGADLSIADTERNTALHWAALAGCATTLQTLLTSDSCQSEDVDFPNVHGDTPLHVCARQDYYQCVVVLLAKGARVDLKNATNESPLDASPDEKGECFRAMSLNSQLSILTNGRIWKKPTILSNDISVGREPYPISCLNEVDDAELPQNFFYISENCHEGQLNINTNINSMQGCNCESGNCSSDSCSCVDLSMKCWYDEEGRLVKDFDYTDPPMVFECNGTCCCNRLTCQSTVIGRRRGTSVFTRVQVYRMNNLTNRKSPDALRGSMIGSQRVCGWGLRAMTPIPCGSPVAQYCGEILTSCEADKRIQDEYMFSLDGMDEYSENESSTTYCIDASTRGSAARFINHSCSANLTPVKVFTWHRDMCLPNVIFFASRDITAGEELTFDYGDKFWSVKYRLFHCMCNSDACRYPIKTQRPVVTSDM